MQMYFLLNMGIFPASHVSFHSGAKSWQVPAIGHNNLLNLRSEFKETYIHPPKKNEVRFYAMVKSVLFGDLFFGGLRIFISISDLFFT